MTLTLPAFLDALDEVLSLEVAHSIPLTHLELAALIRVARDNASEHPTPALGWSEWLDWAGGPCPLPGGTQCLCEMRDPDNIPHVRVAESWFWLHEDRGHDIVRFRYATDDPSGWLPRGDDCDAMMFWQQPPEWIAAGVTPDDALRALRAKEKAKP